jgi:hypothetical protein
VAVLKQIPSGAVPVTKSGRNGMCRGFLTRTDFLEVQPFSTQVLEFFFYFPAVGVFWHYPVHVSKTGKDGTRVIGHGAAREMRVVAKPTTAPDVTSWKYLSQNGTEQQVLDYLKVQNLYKVCGAKQTNKQTNKKQTKNKQTNKQKTNKKQTNKQTKNNKKQTKNKQTNKQTQTQSCRWPKHRRRRPVKRVRLEHGC